MREFFNSMWTLVGISVGAGIFALPALFALSGFWTGIITLFVVAFIMIVIILYLGEVVLRTKENHQLTGLAEKYLGKKGKWIMFTLNTLSLYGTLAVYCIGIGLALTTFLPGSSYIYSLIAFGLLSIIIYFDVTALAEFEYILTPLKLTMVILLSLFLFKYVNFSNFSGFSFSNLLIPFGASVFAFSVMSAVPSMNEELKNKKYLLPSILIGLLLSLIVPRSPDLPAWTNLPALRP